MVAAIGEQTLGPTDVLLSNWPQQRLQRGPGHAHRGGAPYPGGEPVEHCAHLNLTPGRELLFACRYRLNTASNFVVYMSEADNAGVYDPLCGSFVGDLEHGQDVLHSASERSCEAALGRIAGAGPAQPDGWNVYGLQILATLETGNTAEVEEDTAASALLQAGHGLQLGDVRQRGRQRLRGRHRHLPRHGLAGRLEHAPGLFGAAGRSRHAGRAHRARQRGLRPAAVNCTTCSRRRGRLGRSLLLRSQPPAPCQSHAVVYRGRVRQLAEHQASVGLLSSATKSRAAR